MRSVFRVLKACRGLRGTKLDPFGHTQERRLERQLAKDYAAMVTEALLPALRADKLPLAVQIAEVAQRVRGYGPVKLANLATARAQWRALLDAWHGRETDAHARHAPARKVIPITSA